LRAQEATFESVAMTPVKSAFRLVAVALQVVSGRCALEPARRESRREEDASDPSLQGAVEVVHLLWHIAEE